MTTRRHDSNSKAGRHLQTRQFDCWNGGMSNPTSMPAPSPTDSESFGAIGDKLQPLDKEDPECYADGDVTWVARPRNAFIIFRCEYARRNSRIGRGIKRGSGPTSEKSLSKRAAEAWHQLSREEKNHFKVLADLERSEHARLHPDYRFRPVKRVLPVRGPRPRVASSKSRSSDGATAQTDDVAVPGPTRSAASSEPSHQVMCGPLFPPRLYVQGLNGHWSPQPTASILNTLSHSATKSHFPSTDFDSCSPVEPLHSHLEGVLPPLPEHSEKTDLGTLLHPLPIAATSSASLLTDWDESLPYTGDWNSSKGYSKNDILFESSQGECEMYCSNVGGIGHALFVPSCLPAYAEPYDQHCEYICNDLMGFCEPGAAVASQSHMAFSPNSPLFDEAVIGVDI